MGKRVKIDTFHYPLPLGTILLIYEQNLKSLRLEFSAHIPAEIKEFSWEWISLFFTIFHYFTFSLFLIGEALIPNYPSSSDSDS